MRATRRRSKAEADDGGSDPHVRHHCCERGIALMTGEYSTCAVRKDLEQYLREAHFLADKPELTPLTLAIYRQLGNGNPVTLAGLSASLALSLAEAEVLVAEIPAATIERDASGAVTAAGGLSLHPANHVFQVGDLTLHTWCVFDGLFLPQILGKSATLITRCPVTRRKIEISLTPEAVTHANPQNPVMSIVTPDKEARCANPRGVFCNHVNFFADEAAFQDWVADKPEVARVSLSDAHELALARNQFRYGDLLVAS